MDDTPQMKIADSWRLARKRSGIEWIAVGERLVDSFARRLFWRKIDGVHEAGKRCTLIPDWLDADVASYTRAKKLLPPCTFGVRERGSGFELTTPVLTWIKEQHPEDFRRVLRVFPAAMALTI